MKIGKQEISHLLSFFSLCKNRKC